MACLLVCKLPALRAEMLAKNTKIRREWHIPVCFSFLSFLFSLPCPPFFFCSLLPFLFICAPPLSFCCFLPIPLSQSHPMPTLIILLISSFVLYLSKPPPPFSPSLSIYLLLPLSFCANTHSLVLLSPLLFFILDPVVFTSPLLSSNQINWCETIHFHIFLWSPEKRLWSDLNLYVRERI